MGETFLFWFCGGLMVLSGIMMVASRSAVVAACWLIFAFLNAAGIFAALSAAFLAVLQVLVYAGAIMVLFLFVVMMLHGPVLEAERRRLRPRALAAALLPAAAVILALAGWSRGRSAPGAAAELPAGFGSAEQVAALLLDRYVLAFELISIVLLVAIIGAVSLGRRERGLPWQ